MTGAGIVVDASKIKEPGLREWSAIILFATAVFFALSAVYALITSIRWRMPGATGGGGCTWHLTRWSRCRRRRYRPPTSERSGMSRSRRCPLAAPTGIAAPHTPIGAEHGQSRLRPTKRPRTTLISSVQPGERPRKRPRRSKRRRRQSPFSSSPKVPNRLTHGGAGALMAETIARLRERFTRMLADSPRAVRGADSQKPTRGRRRFPCTG